MNRRKFLAASAALPFGARSLMAGERPEPPVAAGPDQSATNISRGSSGRPNLSRYHHTLKRVLSGTGPAYTPEFLLADLTGAPGRRFTEFSGDLSGRWIGALAASSASFGEDFPALHDFVKQGIPLQHPEGFFGKSFSADHPGDNDLALLWGNGRLLVGLVEYYNLQPDPAALAAARRLGDFLVGIGPRFNAQKMAEDFGAGHFATSYICWTQQTEGLALLYAATKDARYRDLCGDISARMERRPGDHVHGYLCSVRGTLGLYEATRDQRYLDRTVAAWKDIDNSGDILITGGVPEAWSPKKKRTEGCAECDWLRLNLALYRATGDEKYLATAESMVFNEFAMNQFASGDFGHAVLEEGGTPEMVAVRAWWCCTLHGLRAFADVNDAVFRSAGDEISYDLPLDGRLKTDSLEIAAMSNLATDGRVKLQVQSATGHPSLALRKPAWANEVTLTHNGKPVADLRVAEIKTGDTIEAKYAMGLRTASADGVQTRPGRHRFYFGPWLLGASSHDQPEYFNELFSDNQIVAGTPLEGASGGHSDFAVPIAAKKFSFVPAEFPDQPMHVELRAVAEQTGYESARWQTAFVIRETS